jgi:hypothetical protein
MEKRVYIIKPAIFAPSILSIVAVVAAIKILWWALVSLPFIWIGSICAQPNLNLANGCLAYWLCSGCTEQATWNGDMGRGHCQLLPFGYRKTIAGASSR